MKKIRIIALIMLSINGAELFSQQLPLFTQYSEYQGIINPAAVNYDYYQDGFGTSIGVSYRDQWINAPDRPRTVAIRAEQVHAPRRGMSFIYGGYLIHDQVGVFKNTGITGRIASMFRFAGNSLDEGAISVGLNIGAYRYQTDLAELRRATIDPVLFSESTNKIYPDVGVGVNFYKLLGNDDYVAFGVSVPQVFGLNLTFKNGEDEFDVTRIQHYYATGSYYKVLGDDRYLEISGWAKKVQNVPVNADFNLRYKFSSIMWLGFGYNTSGIIHTEAGVIFDSYHEDKRFKIAYAYNPTFTSYGVVFGGTHELNLSYLLID